MEASGVRAQKIEAYREPRPGPECVGRRDDSQTHENLSEKTHRAYCDSRENRKWEIVQCAQDIECGRGFVYFDLHGDATPFLLRRIALEEQKEQCDLSDRLIVIDPADPDWSVGLNILERGGQRNSLFVQIAEFTELLKHRWHLETLGARTEELLRNSLYVLAENGFTLLEIVPLLVNAEFRATCVTRVRNPQIKQYFEARYDKLSLGMQTMVREPILNKISARTY